MTMITESRKPINKNQLLERFVIIFICVVVAACVCSVLIFSYKPNQNALGALGSVCMDVICMVVLFILMLGLLFEREQMNKTTRLFMELMIGSMAALFFDFLNWAYDGSLNFNDITYMYTVCSLCMGSILACVLVMYLSSYVNDMYGIKAIRIRARVCVVINLFSFVLTLILALTRTAFDFVDGHYQLGSLYDIVTVIPILTLLYMTGYMIRNVKKIGIHDVLAVAGYLFTMILGAVIEAIYGIGATYVSVTIADIFIFLMLQNKMIEKWMIKSNMDELTGLYNRNAYENDAAELEKEILKDNLVYVSVDVNGLKTANDTAGHGAGDELIVGASTCLKQCLGAYGNLYRTGGDEFAAIIYADETQLNKIKKDLVEVIGHWKGKLVDSLTFSYGFASHKEFTDKSIRELAVIADKRMYDDKAAFYQRKGISRKGITI